SRPKARGGVERYPEDSGVCFPAVDRGREAHERAHAGEPWILRRIRQPRPGHEVDYDRGSMSVAIVAGEGPLSDAISLELESLGVRVERLGDADVSDRRRAIAAAKRIGAASVLVTCPSLYDHARFGEM